jgi:ABC-type sugar transport system, ATPase component
MFLEMKGISKAFGMVQALHEAQLSVRPGEIHGLLGENGAGKTTLMNVLSGTFAPDAGHIIVNGEKINGMTPRKSSALKIRFIHQELNLCNDLAVYENMFLGEELTTRFGLVDKAAQIRRAQKVLEEMNTTIQATAPVGDLDTAEKQLVEIARALLFQSELIIMDEPTTALNNKEIQNLFGIMLALKGKGVSFIYISHKMPELFAVCDSYTVMRDGKFIQTGSFKDIDEHQATELLIGRTFVDSNLKAEGNYIVPDEVLLSVENISGSSFHDVSFDIHKGEIIAVTGLQGAGSAELAMALFGAVPITSGSIKTKAGALAKHSIQSMMKDGIGMIPRNRKERGILPDMSICDNNSIAYFATRHKRPFISERKELARFERNRSKMGIKVGSPTDLITSLSGGNQQKVIIGKWLEIDADVYIMDNPTQGIDVGAKYAIYQLIIEMAKEGKAVLVFSTEFPEIYHIADRCLVMYKGGINGNIPRGELTEVNVMEFSTGTKSEVSK